VINIKDKSSAMKLSVITINYNNAIGLRKTIESVVNQTFRDYEYIVIDGGSTDGSVDVIKEYADKIDYWVSEPDKGIYNAMNKGVAAAHGEYTNFLNSGDSYYTNNVLDEVFQQNVVADIICGNILTDKNHLLTSPVNVTLNTFIQGSIPHPSSFIRRILLLKRPYDESEPINGDWVFFMTSLIIDNVTYHHVENIIALFDTNGISSKVIFNDKNNLSIQQTIDYLNKYFPERVLDDYKIFRGCNDDFHRLFFVLSNVGCRRFIYIILVILLKLALLNRGWIKSFPLFNCRNRQCL
jgi:glycosyltransferase involved in cell wall biosynthesis